MLKAVPPKVSPDLSWRLLLRKALTCVGRRSHRKVRCIRHLLTAPGQKSLLISWSREEGSVWKVEPGKVAGYIVLFCLWFHSLFPTRMRDQLIHSIDYYKIDQLLNNVAIKFSKYSIKIEIVQNGIELIYFFFFFVVNGKCVEDSSGG